MPGNKKKPPNPPSPLQKRFNSWLSGLTALVPASPVEAGLVSLSPLKRAKHTPVEAGPPPVGRYIVRLLAEQVVRLSCEGCPAEVVDLLAGPALSQPETELCREVARDITALSAGELTGWNLAGLKLWPGRETYLKRNGSFYTSDRLARHITTRTIRQVTTVLDPACGGGAFLLAALERLAELQPATAASDLLLQRIYGLDLEPLAVSLARLALLRRLAEMQGGLLPTWLPLALALQLRPGNALVGPPGATPPTHEAARRAEVFAARALVGVEGLSRPTLELYRRYLADGEQARRAVADRIAALPVFNLPGQGRQLAALHPFDWRLEFPEVFEAGGFGCVVGNPPYIGFNDYSGIEKAYFARVYAPIYNLKADLFYYFIQRGVELLAPEGRLGYVVARFWKEAAFAAGLRRWLATETSLEAIEDYGGEQFFEQAEVDVCLLFTVRARPDPAHQFEFSYEGRTAPVQQSGLSEGASWAWLRRQSSEHRLLSRIAEQSCPLGEVAICRTGVQTGLDRVFFVDATVAARLEPAVLRRAVKSPDVKPGRVEWRGLWLIYPPAGLEASAYPALLDYLGPYRPALERRLRYDKAFPYYELQWPRLPEVFEAPAKLLTPYKARCNTFGLDTGQFYFSTDVISVIFPAEWRLEQTAVNFLNSRLATFQFRSFGKPVGGGQWDYYANPVKRLAFPRQALPGSGPDCESLRHLARPGLSPAEIDELVFELYGLNGPERDLILRGSTPE